VGEGGGGGGQGEGNTARCEVLYFFIHTSFIIQLKTTY